MNISNEENVILKWNKYYIGKAEQNNIDSQRLGKDINKAEENQQGALSEKAYPENAHFIYEIIQNAEDSSYLKNKKSELHFHLFDNGIMVLSNQDGFTEEDINSICLLGGGDKISKKDQFIGEKGLGFRSVFKITNTPCISSNGYKFYFDINEMYGRVKPILLREYRDVLPSEFNSYGGTAIYLPYSINDDAILELEKDFELKIEPKLILFLKKLNSISITKSETRFMSIEKSVTKEENSELCQLSNNEKYYIFRKEIDVSLIKEKRRETTKKREIILAFPEKEYSSSTNVFAFLPTDIDSRLNFTIQADFLLDTNRGDIDENEWNKNIFKEIKIFIIENIDKFQSHSKLKYTYLKYFLQETKSNNKFIDKLYAEIISEIKNKNLILSQNETWQKPQNIILLEENIKIETKYLKILFGQQYEQVHEKFELDNYFIDKFQIIKIDKEKLLDKIYAYLNKHNDINLYKKDEVLYFTNIIATYLNFGRDARKFDEDYFQKIKKALPILPKYKAEKKLYLYDVMYISSEYKPDILIESMCEESEFDFSKYNFLSNDYLDANNKNLENFIRKVIGEQQGDKNRKTLDFFAKYPEVLQNYLKKNIQINYPKILDFLIKNQDDNKDKISNISLILTKNANFLSSTGNVYFSNDSDAILEVLNDELFKIVNQKQEYKEFFIKVFKVKEADILNIIINEYLPWIKKNAENRDKQNDTKLLEYTKAIIENFGKFEKEQQNNIKNSLVFISSNNTRKYRKSSYIYLPQDISQIVFGTDSIDEYISDKSRFEFLNESYKNIFKTPDEKKTKEFLKYFSFEKNIKNDDIVNFIESIKSNLDLKKSIKALELIAKSISDEKKKIENIGKFRVFSQDNHEYKVENLFYEQVEDFEIAYLNQEYKKNKVLDILKQYFLPPLKNIEPYIVYLEKINDYKKAERIYSFLDKHSERGEGEIVSIDELKKEFKRKPLILDSSNNKKHTSECAWKEQKSKNSLTVLSKIYNETLKQFFLHKIGIAHEKTIAHIIEDIEKISSKTDVYYDLLIDLNDLISEENNQRRFYDDMGIKSQTRNFPELIREKNIFILDNDKKNKDNNFYFNDLKIEYDDEKLKDKIFSVNEKYPIEHYSKLIGTLKIKRLKELTPEYSNGHQIYSFDLQKFRSMLHFAYDLLFTKFPDEYKELEKKDNLLELNEVQKVSIHEDIVAQITIDKITIEVDRTKHYIEDKVLYIVNESDLFKIISDKIGSISDKDIKDFYNEVIQKSQSKDSYYQKEEIKEKQNFPLNISDVMPEEQNTFVGNKPTYRQEEDNGSKNNYDEDEITETEEQKSEEEIRGERKSGADQIADFERYVDSDSEKELMPSIVRDTKKFQEDFSKKQTKRISEILDTSNSISEKTKCKIKNEMSYDGKGNNNITSNQKMERFGHEETKNKFKRKDFYLGQCQICGFTFKTKTGNHCERFTWTDFGRGSWTSEQKQIAEHNLIDVSNSLCLCSRCYSIIKQGGDFKASFLTTEFKNKLKSNYYTYDKFIIDMKIDKPLHHPECFKEHVEWQDMCFLEIRLNKNEEYIYFTEEHLIAFFQFLKS